ncbi:ABC transporter substrate-binding protein [Bacillus sp. FSL K6-3431]|uniref:ABC transporter substrate-binding protein n=1 Tax=Bacillus sp. FSL K6-3431 TaxID=2921500 RepID=UPI0030F53659
MKEMKKIIFMTLMACLALLLISCTNQESGGSSDSKSPEKANKEEVESGEREPITIKAAVIWDETMFNERFKEPIETKFPHITMEHIHIDTGNRESLEELFASGEVPDLFFTMNQEDMEYFELDQDLGELFEANKMEMDTSHLNQSLVDTIRGRDAEGRLVAWPYENTYYAMLYNKDIFDKFGIAYPSDELTWEETFDLARKLTQERDGVQYRGLEFRDTEVMLSQLSVNATNPETGEVEILQKDEFSNLLGLFSHYYDTIPDSYEGELRDEARFSTEQTTAMLITNAQALNWWQDNGINYDIATVPTWSDHPGVAPRGFLHTLTMNPLSENQEDILNIFNYFASEDYQNWMSRNGIGIVSNQKESQDEFFQEYESTHDKNIAAIFKNEAASPPERISLWDKYVNIDFQKYYESNMDPNEFLRVIMEEAETEIQEAKGSK